VRETAKQAVQPEVERRLEPFTSLANKLPTVYPAKMDQPKPSIYYRKNAKGLLEGIDLHTGKVVVVSHTLETFDPARPRYSKVKDPEGNTVYIESSLLTKSAGGLLTPHTYNQFTADLILQKVVEGHTLLNACKELNVEYSVVVRWKTENNSFREQLAQAYKDRTEVHHDIILEIAANSRDAKTQIDALKWSTDKNNPEKFGNKTKITGDANAPVAFTILTGVPEKETIDITPQASTGHLHPADEELEAQEIVPEVGIETE
jgi:hypothetical protein